MKCEKCGKELQEGWNSCPYCGASVGENGDDSPKSKKQPSDSKPSKKKHKVRNIAIVIVVLIIIFALISGGGDDETANSSGNAEVTNEEMGSSDTVDSGADSDTTSDSDSYVVVEGGETVPEENVLNEEDDDPQPEEYLHQEGSKLPVTLENSTRSDSFGYAQITFDVVNKKDIDFRTAKFDIMVWDANMLPVKVNSSFDENANEYVETLTAENIAANNTTRISWDLNIPTASLVHYNVFLINAEDMDGNIWVNPIWGTGEEAWAGKKLDSSMYAYTFSDDAE